MISCRCFYVQKNPYLNQATQEILAKVSYPSKSQGREFPHHFESGVPSPRRFIACLLRIFSHATFYMVLRKAKLRHQGPVVRKLVSANPGLKIKLGFDFSCLKAYIYRYNVLWGFILVSGKTEGNKIYTAKLSAKL